MRLLALFALSLCTVVDALKSEARLYTFDTWNEQKYIPSYQDLSPDVAELIVARRLGFSETARLGQVDDNIIQRLNEFGGHQPGILGSQRGDNIFKLLLSFEDHVNDASFSSSANHLSTSGLSISHHPVDFLSEFFVDGLVDASKKGAFQSCSYKLGSSGLRGDLIIYIPAVDNCPPEDWVYQQSESDPRGTMAGFLYHDVSSWVGHPTAAVLRIMPDGAQSSIPKEIYREISSNLRYFSDNNNQQSSMIILSRKNSNWLDTTSHATSHLEAVRQVERTSSSSDSKSLKTRSGRDIRQVRTAALTLMPVCYSSEASCTEATKNCSGHGQCYRKYESKEESKGDCYACKCGATQTTNQDGTVKSIQWGGTACQKKDVSTPFFIIGGFSVLLVTAISLAVRMLFSIGQEELPSVLGAGVAAPRAHK